MIGRGPLPFGMLVARLIFQQAPNRFETASVAALVASIVFTSASVRACLSAICACIVKRTCFRTVTQKVPRSIVCIERLA